MKKILLAVTAALAITGCSQNEEFENAGQKAEINFGTIVSKSTRAIITENTSFANFVAYGYAHGENDFSGTVTSAVMEAAAYEKNNNVWSTSGHYYWPESEKVTFFGYGGVTTAVYAKATSAFPTLKYTVLQDITKQEDLVVAQVANKTKGVNNPSVNLEFKHALAQVYFKLRGNDAALTYTVSKIAMKNVKTEGTFEYGATPGTSIGQWTLAADAPTNDYSITLSNKEIIGDATAVALDDASSQVMILMPQALNNVQVEVTYVAKKGNVVVHSNTDPVTIQLTGSWDAGSKTAYVLSLNGDAISLTGTSDDTSWTEKADVNTDK